MYAQAAADEKKYDADTVSSQGDGNIKGQEQSTTGLVDKDGNVQIYYEQQYAG